MKKREPDSTAGSPARRSGRAAGAAEAVSPVCAFLKRPSLVDFPGRLAAVFFVSGCNFRCGFCHNAALLARRGEGIAWPRLDRACRDFAANWVAAAVVTGGEPTLDAGLPDLLRFFRRLRWAVKLDTNGSNPDALAVCLPLVDYVAMDVKTGLSRYAALTGFDGTDRIARSVELIRERARDYEFRTTVIGTVHDDAAMAEIGALIAGAKRYVLQPFVPRDDLPDARLANEPRTSPDRMAAIRANLGWAAGEVAIRGEVLPA